MADYQRFNALYLYGTNSSRDAEGEPLYGTVYGVFGFWWPLFLDRSEAQRVDPNDEVLVYTFKEYSYSQIAEDEGIGERGKEVPFYMPKYAYTARGPNGIEDRPSGRMLLYPPPIPGGYASWPEVAEQILWPSDPLVEEVDRYGGHIEPYDPRNAVPGQNYEFLPPPWYPALEPETVTGESPARTPAPWEQRNKYFTQEWPDNGLTEKEKQIAGLMIPEEQGGLSPLPVPEEKDLNGRLWDPLRPIDVGMVRKWDWVVVDGKWEKRELGLNTPQWRIGERRLESIERSRTDYLLDLWLPKFERWFNPPIIKHKRPDQQEPVGADDVENGWMVGTWNAADVDAALELPLPWGSRAERRGTAFARWSIMMTQELVILDSLAREREESVLQCKEGYIPDYIIPHHRDDTWWKEWAREAKFTKDILQLGVKPRNFRDTTMNAYSLNSYGDWVDIMNRTLPGIKRASNTEDPNMRSDIVIQWASPYDGKLLKRPTQREYEKELLYWREYYRRRNADREFQNLEFVEIYPTTFTGPVKAAASEARWYSHTPGQCYQLKGEIKSESEDIYINALKDRRRLGGPKLGDALSEWERKPNKPDPIDSIDGQPIFDFPSWDPRTWDGQLGQPRTPGPICEWPECHYPLDNREIRRFTCPSGPGMLDLHSVQQVPYMVEWGGPGYIDLPIDWEGRGDEIRPGQSLGRTMPLYNHFNLGWEWSPIGTPIPLGVALVDYPGVGAPVEIDDPSHGSGKRVIENWHEVYPDAQSPGPYNTEGPSVEEEDKIREKLPGTRKMKPSFGEDDDFGDLAHWRLGGGWMGPVQPWNPVQSVPLYTSMDSLFGVKNPIWHQVWPLSPVENEEDYPSIIRKKNSDLGFKTIILPSHPGGDPDLQEFLIQRDPPDARQNAQRWADIYAAEDAKLRGRPMNIEDFPGVEVIHLGQGGREGNLSPWPWTPGVSREQMSSEVHPIHPGLNWPWTTGRIAGRWLGN